MPRRDREPDWWVSEYAKDIHLTMREKEGRRRAFHGRSPQLQHRERLVEWLFQVCDRFSLSYLTHHLGVMFLDFFMDSHNIETEQLQLVALSCLLLAAKSEEKDILIPKTSELNQTVDEKYSLSDFNQMEVALLDFFQWDLIMPTTAHFLDYYMRYTILDSDLERNPNVFETIEAGKIFAEKYAQYFRKMAIKIKTFLKYPPSLVAASCVSSIRICLTLTPYWPSTLQRITGHGGTELSACVEYMMKCFEEKEKEMNTSNDDSGISIDSLENAN